MADKIIVITAPSGSGKTTLVKRLLAACPQLSFSISACTRTPRPGEQHGKDYYFHTEEDFKKLEAEIRTEVNEAADFAQNSPEPDVSELWTDVLIEA